MNTKGLILNSQGKLDINAMRVNSTLTYEDYIKLDKTIIETAKQPLNMISDLISRGLVFSDVSLNQTIIKHQRVSEMTGANVSINGLNKSEKDILTFDTVGTPLAIFRKDFSLDIKQVGTSGIVKAENMLAAARVVGESMEDMCWNGLPTLGAVEGYYVYGLTTFPSRNTKTISHAWGGGSDDPIADVQAMISQLRADKFYGPYILYVSESVWMFLTNDYSTLKGDKTFKERIEAIPSMGPGSVKWGPGLDSGELVLVQMTSDVIDLAVAQMITSFEQPSKDRFVTEYTVFSAMSTRIKADKNGNCGIVHATGA